MGSPKELLRRPLVGFWAWLLCGIAMGAALPTQNPAIKDDYSTPDFPSTLIFNDYFKPTLPTTIEEDLDFPAETPSPSETNGETPEAVGEGEASSPGESPKSGLASNEDDSGPLTSTPKTFKIPEDLKETPEVPSVDKNVLTQVNSSDQTLGKETLQGDPAVASQEAPKETPSPDLEAGHEATELITERYSGITDGPVTVFATLEEDLSASPSGEEISRGSPPEGDNPLEDIPGEPNLDEELKPTSTSWEVTEAAPLEAEKDSPEPSMDESGTLGDPSSNSAVLPSIPEDLADQETGENIDAGEQPSLSSDDSPGTSQPSTGFPPIWPSPTHEKFGSPGTNDSYKSPTNVDFGSPEGRGDTALIPSSSGPELNHESPINLPSEEPEDLVDAEVSNSSSSDRTMDAPSDSGPPGDTLVRTSQLNASDIPWMGRSVTPEIPSQLPEDDELGPTSTVKEEEEDLGNPKSNEGTSLVSPLPGQESEIPDEKRSGDLLSGTASSLNPGVETANSELEDSEATATSNNVPEDEINPISSDSATVSKNESGALFDMTASSPPPVDHEGTDKAQEPVAETQGSPTEASAPASTDGSSSEKEGSEVTPSGSSGNIGSSLKTIPSASDEVDTEANSEDGSGSDLSSPDTELSPSSGTPPPMGRSGTLSDQLSPLVENALTSGSSEGERTFPSTSPDEALSGPLISEPDTTELPSNLLPGSQLPKENDMETSSRNVEDSPPAPVDNEGAAKNQGPYAEASAPGSTNEPSSEREGSEILPSGSPGNTGPSENSDTIPSVSPDEVDTQGNSEDHGVSDLPPSETELSSISGTPLSTSSQPPKEDEAETHSEVPEDSVSINGEETSSAPSIINPQSDPAEAPEESNISGDLSDGPTISPKEDRIGSTSEPRVKEEPLLDGDNTQDKINTPSEQQQGSEDALETSIPSSGDEADVKSGTTSPLVDTETSTKELSGETSSATIEVMLPNSEKEDGELSPSLSSKTLDSSPSNEVVDESRDGDDGTGSASSAKTAVTVSNDGQPGSDFPVGQSVTSPVGGILALAPIEDEETSVSRDDAQLTKEAVSSQDATPQSASSAEGMETSASEPSTVGSQPSPDGEAAPGTSKEANELQTFAASEKVSPLDSSTTESQEPTRSEGGEFYGALNKESPAFPVEVAGTANSPPATDKSSQFLPEDVASSDGVEDSEDITNTISEVSSQDPLDRGSEPKTPTSEEGTKGRTDGELSLNKDGTETASVESANNGGSQLPPDGDQPSTTIGASEISEGPSSVNGKEGSLIPSAAESHSTSTFTEEVENADSESGTQPESQAPLDVSPTTEVQDSKSSEAVEEDTSNNVEKLSLTSSATESQSPGISDDEVDVSGDTGNGESSPHEELEMVGSGSTNNGGAQPSVAAGGATETSDVSDKEEPLESSSSANEAETSLGSSAAESSTAPEDQEISGKPSDGDGMGAVNSEPATNAEPQPSPNDGPGGAPASEEAGIAEVPGTGEESFPTSAPESQAISSSNEGETSKTATNAGSQLPPGGELAAGTPPLDGAEISGASSSVPGGKGSLSPSTPESPGDSTSTKELGTASRKSTSAEGSQLSADGTSPEDSLPSEGAEEPTESPPPSTRETSPGKPGLQTKPGAPQLSSKPEVLANTSKLASGKPELQTKPGAPQLSSKPEILANTSKLASGKPGLQTKPGAPQLSSKPEVPAKTSTLASGKPGLQGEVDAPQLSSKTEVPAKTSTLASGKPGLQGEVDAPQLSSKTEVPAKTSTLASGKPGLQGEVDAPQLSSKTEVPAKTSTLASGKPGLQGEVDAPQLSSKTEVPAKTSTLASGKPGLQLKADTGLLSFNSDVLANSERTLPGKSGSASSESTSDSDEKDGDSSSSPELSEEHQTFMKGKVALDLSNAKPGRSKPGVHLALSGVGLLATKSSEPTGKAAKKRSDSKKSKDKKTKPDEKSTIINGAPSDAAVSLYPYGASVNDKQYVERKVDFNSPLFKPEIGIPLGKSLRNSLYGNPHIGGVFGGTSGKICIGYGASNNCAFFTDNGQIVFPASDKDISSYPNPPPRGFNGREEAPMLAVFWDNADFSKGSGTIFYQEYPCGNSAKHPLVQDVEAKIRRYVSSSYRARWLLKVTWVKVQHYPAQGQTSKTNTYQAILTTDGYRTYALFLYQEGGMQWDYAKLSAPNVLIGYTSGDGYFKNDHLMTKTPAEKYRPDVFQGYNTDMRGLWIYKLDSWIRVNYRQRCLDWLGHERLPSSWNRGLPPCPCSLQQGMTDNRYTISQKGGQNTDSTLLYSSRPNNYGAGVRCLYNGNGQLQEGRQERIWKKSRKNYPNNDEELKLHDWCCHKAGIPQTCEKYDQMRPRIGCQGYKPPIRG